MAPETIQDDQRDVIQFLSRPESYGLIRGPIRRVDTHISIVWLAGDRAFKLKRAVRFDYVDFSSIDRRGAACEAELRLNRRTAPALYRRVRAITRRPEGGLEFDGDGERVDWVVEMIRFDEDSLFDRLAEEGQLELALMDGLAATIAGFHDAAMERPDRGGIAGMRWVADGNERSFEEHGPGILDRDTWRRLVIETDKALRAGRDLLERRRLGGSVRACHGDLHLRNICLFEGVPTIFDAVEFNEDISCVDVLYDLAFLLMDLWRRGLRGHANAVLCGYSARRPDLEGLALMPLFLSCRAAVRAKTSLAAAAVAATGERGLFHRAARQYLDLAAGFVKPPRPCLVAVGGFSGAGKSTLARGLAPALGPAPGALVLRSDLIRKSLLGVEPLARLGSDAYRAATNAEVYRLIRTRAGQALRAGHAVIADAVHAAPAERAAIKTVAEEAGVPFVGVWLDGAPAVLAGRLDARAADASDATADVLERQVAHGTGEVAWYRLDGTPDPGAVLGRAIAHLESRGFLPPGA